MFQTLNGQKHRTPTPLPLLLVGRRHEIDVPCAIYAVSLHSPLSCDNCVIDQAGTPQSPAPLEVGSGSQQHFLPLRGRRSALCVPGSAQIAGAGNGYTHVCLLVRIECLGLRYISLWCELHGTASVRRSLQSAGDPRVFPCQRVNPSKSKDLSFYKERTCR